MNQAGANEVGKTPQWIYRGQLIAPPLPEAADPRQEHELLERQGYVKISSSPEGTAVTWAVFAPNWASLYFVMDWLGTLPAPYTLKYYLSGWFEERFPDSNAARHRIHAIIGKSDVHLSSRTYVQPANPNRPDIPEILKDALGNRASREFGVDCAYDKTSGRFSVERIGQKSEIARVWGMSPVSYPSMVGHTYDQIVSAAYHRVLTTGEPHYDHVCAAMITPDSDVLWCTYQRVILPRNSSGGKKGVLVFAKEAPVDIKLV